MSKDNLGDRMKEYEAVPRTQLINRMPVIIRLDGKAFHTFTKRFKNMYEYGHPSPKDAVHYGQEPLKKIRERTSPFDEQFHQCMRHTTTLLTQFVQNACFAYTQSDEISLLLIDYKSFTTDAWFGNQVQKMVSVSASMATAFFYSIYQNIDKIGYGMHMPMFDARVFNLPREEVCNYFIWRQKDAMRNSVNMLGQFHFSHKQLQGKKVTEVRDMLHAEKGIDWSQIPSWQQRGICVRSPSPISSSGARADQEIPIFTEDRAYVEEWLDPEYFSTMSGVRDA